VKANLLRLFLGDFVELLKKPGRYIFSKNSVENPTNIYIFELLNFQHGIVQ